jgi:hypothetical protein
MDWGDRHLAGPEGPPMVMRHDGCDATVHAELVCERGHSVGVGQTKLIPQPGARAATT